MPSSPPSSAGGSSLKTYSAVGRAFAGLIAFGATLVLLAVPRAAAQSCSSSSISASGFREYYVLGRESHVYNMMQRVATGEGGALTSGATHSVVSVVAGSNNQVIYYDHWEGGLDPGLNSSFATFPNPQQTVGANATLVLGDGNAANGNACAFTTSPCAGDVITAGMALTFDSPNVPLPRVAAQVFFDGGDRIVTSGGPLSLIHNQDPLSTLIGGAVEIISRQAYGNATSYSIPAGEDLYLGNDTVTEIFKYVDIDLIAFQNNTQVTITSPGAGTVSFTLQQGQHYTNRGCTVDPCANGLIDDATAAPFITINSGAKISSTGPLAGMIHSGGDGTYSTDIFPILPDLLHGNDYLIPSMGDNAAVNGNRPMNLYIFNPDPLNAISVQATDSVGTRTFNVPANTTVDYFSGALPNRFVPANSTVRLTSVSNFWGLTVHDHQTTIADWGYAWLATKFLTTNYTVGYAPGTRAAPPISGPNRSPVWIGATQDNTLVKIDFNNDGVFDLVDTNGDDVADVGDVADASCATPATLCLYRISAPNSLGNRMGLRVFDQTDHDNTGTVIVATRPVAVVYGQDPELGVASDLTPDTGYTIYPSLQTFLDPALTIDKTASPPSVSASSGGTVTFTLTAQSYGFGPLTAVTVFDDLPAGLTCTGLAGNYVTNSSRITYPDLSQQVGDAAAGAACSVVAGRNRLTWTLSPNSLSTNQTVTVSFQVTIPAGGAACFQNDATDRATLGGTVFQASDSAAVVRTNVGFVKSVVHDGTPEPGETVTYNVDVANNGTAAETTDVVTDPLPASMTFVTGSITTTAPFGAGSYSAGTNTVQWTAASIPAAATLAAGALTSAGTTATVALTAHGFVVGSRVSITGAAQPEYNGTFTVASVPNANTFTYTFAGSTTSPATGTIRVARVHRLSFQATIVPGTAAGTVISNVAGYQSVQTAFFQSAPAEFTVVGPLLVGTKTVTPSPLHPNEIASFEIAVTNSGAGAAANLIVTDPLAGTNTTYLPATLQQSLNGGPFVALTDAADGDGGTLAGTTLTFTLASLGAGQDVRFRFQARVNPGTSGLFVANQASLSSTQTGSQDTNLAQVPIVGNATINGHVFLDAGGVPGVQDGDDPNLASVTVTVTDCTGAIQTATTDAFGNYSVVVLTGPGCGVPGATLVDVADNDPDIPAGSTESTAVDPQTVNAVAGGTVNALAVGFAPPPLAVVKTSSAGGTVAPGQTVTYTVTITNTSGVTQTGISVSDPLPTGTSYVPGSSQIRAPAGKAFRVTEYFLDNAGADSCTEAGLDFAGTTCTLTLNQALAQNYFVIVQGSDADGTGDMLPSQDYVALTGAPAGSPGTAGAGCAPAANCLANSPANNQIVLSRVGDDQNWSGVVTVVECLADCATNGFTLRDVRRVTHAGAGIAGSLNTSTAWTDLARVALIGGYNGAGCTTADTTDLDHEVCHVRLFPSGTNTINWTRDATDGGLSDATSTVMAVQWGSAWSVQRATILNGDVGGANVDGAAEYNTAAITPVTRYRTWVWGTGHTDFGETGASGEAVILTLGDGQNQNPTEATVAAGVDIANTSLDFDIYTMSHPSLQVDYRFVDTSAAGTQPVATDIAVANRMAIVYNSLADQDDNYPGPIFSARYTTNLNIDLVRRRTGSDFSAWVQGVSFDNVFAYETSAGSAPASLVTPATLCGTTSPAACQIPPGHTLTITYQVLVDSPLAGGITQITNVADPLTTQQDPPPASVTDLVVRPSVVVEPNNAGFAVPGGTITFTQTVTNNSPIADSYAITLRNDAGVTWALELLDPDSGAVIARDSNGDGVWDSGTVNTGSLAPGASRTYQVRATVPGGATPGVQDTATLRAVSSRSSLVFAEGTNEITVLAGALGFVDVLPDNSGVVEATGGSYVTYPHYVVNNMGVADTFSLTTANSLAGAGWTTSVHYDTNGDGVYTPGADLAIANTALIPNGLSQLVFVRVNVPAGGAVPGTTQLTILTATSLTTPTRYDSVTDTTTVVAPVALDLSGGGTRMVVPTDTAIFPGTLYNLGAASSDFEFTVSPSSLLGGDGLNHPTQLWIDVNGDGIYTAGELAATDSNGDGVWDSIAAGFNDDGDLFPDVDLAAGATLAYEIRKPIDPAQRVPQEFVTLLARASLAGSGEGDSVTVQWLIAALTRATIRGLRVDPAGVLEFATGMQRNTRSFNLYETRDESGEARTLLNDAPILAPLPDSLAPIVYRVDTRPLREPFLLIEEIETTGKRLWKGPFAIGDEALRRSFERIEERLDRAGVPSGDARLLRAATPRRRGGARGTGEARVRNAFERPTLKPQGIRIETAAAGTAVVALSELKAAGLPADVPDKALRLTSQGHAVPFALVDDPASGPSLQFEAEDLETDYTGSNVYLLTWHGLPLPMGVPLTRSADPLLPGFTRIERTFTYLASSPDGTDPFLWDVLVSDGATWPYPWWDPSGEWGRFDLPDLAPGATGPTDVRVRLVGYTQHRHLVEARINGFSVGSLSFDGATGATLLGNVPAELLRATGNDLQLVYRASALDTGEPVGDGSLYLDYLDVAARSVASTRSASVVSLTPYDASLPSFKGVQYLIVTHPDFREAALRIAELKRADGLPAAVVETDNAYDRYSGGIVEAKAIRALIREVAARSGRLRYVLLLGDDTFDPQNFTGFAPRVFVPSLMSRDAAFGRIPSENLYADLDDDGSPDVAIGRLPAQTAEQAELMADKVANQQALLAAQPARTIFAVDNPREDDAPFRAEAEEMAAVLGAAAETTSWSDIAQGAAAARTSLLSAWGAGARTTSYFGHGGPEIWADEHLISVEDVQSLGGALKPTVVLMWACESQWYLNLWGPSLGEALFLVPDGGAVASFGPSGIAPPAKHRVLYEKVYARLGTGKPLGEIIRRAKAEALAERPNSREAVDGYNLIGDPALVLPEQP